MRGVPRKEKRSYQDAMGSVVSPEPPFELSLSLLSSAAFFWRKPMAAGALAIGSASEGDDQRYSWAREERGDYVMSR